MILRPASIFRGDCISTKDAYCSSKYSYVYNFSIYIYSSSIYVRIQLINTHTQLSNNLSIYVLNSLIYVNSAPTRYIDIQLCYIRKVNNSSIANCKNMLQRLQLCCIRYCRTLCCTLCETLRCKVGNYVIQCM
jgi:hypothetical protein